MGYSIVIDRNEPEPLATIHGWKLFKEWAYTLPVESFFLIVHLAEHGYALPVSDLAEQLDTVLNAGSPWHPTDPGIRQIASDLLTTLRAALKSNPRRRLAFVSDGMGSGR